MRTGSKLLGALTLVCAPACAQPGKHAVLPAPAQTVPSALVRVAAHFGVITSAFRTVAHNRAVGGVPDSYHLLGQAIDVVRRRGISHAQLAAALSSAGFQLIESLDEGDHSHFAFGSRAKKPAQAPPPPSPRPGPPPPPLVAADEHGKLLVDIKR